MNFHLIKFINYGSYCLFSINYNLIFSIMNCFKFLYDVFVWITSHYSEMPESFRKSFPEDDCVNGRLFLSDVTQVDSDFNINFKNYE